MANSQIQSVYISYKLYYYQISYMYIMSALNYYLLYKLQKQENNLLSYLLYTNKNFSYQKMLCQVIIFHHYLFNSLLSVSISFQAVENVLSIGKKYPLNTYSSETLDYDCWCKPPNISLPSSYDNMNWSTLDTTACEVLKITRNYFLFIIRLLSQKATNNFLALQVLRSDVECTLINKLCQQSYQSVTFILVCQRSFVCLIIKIVDF